MEMKIIFSKPITCHSPTVPDDFIYLGNEAITSLEYGRHAHKQTVCRIKEHIKKSGHQNSVVIAGRYAESYFIQRGILGIKNPPAILLDVEWHWRYRNRISCKGLINKLYHNIIGHGSTLISVFCKAEKETYSEAYGIPIEKLVWIPFCSMLDEIPVNEAGSEYIFSGGVHDRDYSTLFAAISGTSIRLHVAAPKEHFTSIAVPENVKIIGMIPRDEYFRQINQAKAVVLSLDSTSDNCSLRFPGVITYVSAMRMRKCLIVNEPRGTASYIVDGEHGILPPPADPYSLKEAILKVWEDKAFRESLANNAYERSHSEFGYERYFSDLRSYSRIALEE